MKGEPRRFQRSAQTVNNYLVVLGSLFSTARREWHWVNYNPVADVAKLSTGHGRVRYLSEDERTRLLTETAKDPTLAHVRCPGALHRRPGGRALEFAVG